MKKSMKNEVEKSHTTFLHLKVGTLLDIFFIQVSTIFEIREVL